jgi:hypothetical protein
LYHIVVTRTSTTYKVYVNGAEDSNTHSDAGWGLSNTHIGYGYAANVFDGVINEVSVWNDDFTLAQVQELFNDGVPLAATEHSVHTASSAALLGYWRNDGASSWEDRSTDFDNDSTSIAGSPETLLLPEGTTSGKDILGFPLTHTNNGWLNLSGSEYVDAGKSSALANIFDGGGTVSGWLKYESTAFTAVIEKDKWEVNLDGGGKIRLYYYFSGDEGLWITTNNVITLGQWTHFAITYDNSSSNNAVIYIDSASVAVTRSDTPTGTRDTDIASVLKIGTRNWLASFFDGQLDEIKVYNRALSAAEISKNYKHGKSKHS